MRLIDADAAKNELYDLIKELVKATVDPLPDEAIGSLAAYSIIENAQTVNKWISVNDRLPECAGWYLVYYNGSQMNVAYFKGKTWPFNNHYHTITHWQYLPEPPKEDNDALN